MLDILGSKPLAVKQEKEVPIARLLNKPVAKQKTEDSYMPLRFNTLQNSLEFQNSKKATSLIKFNISKYNK